MGYMKCSCGAILSAGNKNSRSARRHLAQHPGHYEVSRWTFHEPSRIMQQEVEA